MWRYESYILTVRRRAQIIVHITISEEGGLPLIFIACDCNRWSPHFLQTPAPPYALPHRWQAFILPPLLLLNNQEQCPSTTTSKPHPPPQFVKNATLPPFNPLLVFLSLPFSSSWGSPAPPYQAPIYQHLWGSHREKINPLCSSMSEDGRWGGSGRTREKVCRDIGNSWQLFHSEGNLLFQVPYLKKTRWAEDGAESCRKQERLRSRRKFSGLIWHSNGKDGIWQGEGGKRGKMLSLSE